MNCARKTDEASKDEKREAGADRTCDHPCYFALVLFVPFVYMASDGKRRMRQGPSGAGTTPE